MGLGGISIWQLLIVLVIVLLLFGTKRLRNMGSDLGTAFKGFKKAVSDGEKEVDEKKLADANKQDSVIEGEATREKDKTDA
ncbi:Sec-independent protein translocase subunit TatA [Thiolapillus brandeum]|uniref:Sec-independent protein translocase protein TatA n=1 Tax=Thiolapillus brandeum TaxID=1076588 RepID=A0A7U6GHC4_9GAMM|nr:Sec-independent protein translocase subunit TatA [Thiolapillus brandeum]BAO43651.1 twin-arginine translocation system component TatA [Thiolapillus brandeum]